METPVYFRRETENYYVYETVAESGEVKVLYLPKKIFRLYGPSDSMNLILSKRKVHVCNCEYCTRSEK